MMKKERKKEEIKSGAIIGYANMIINILITIIYTPLMLKLMGQSEYGLYSLVTSVIGYLSVLDMGFGNAAIRFISRSKAKQDEEESKINGIFLMLYLIVGILSLIIGSIIYFNAEKIFANSLTIEELAKARILIIISLINISLSFPLSVFDSYVIANEKFIFSKVIACLKTILTPIIMIPLLLLGYKSIAMTLVIAVLNIFIHLLSLTYCFKNLKMKIVFNFKKIDIHLLHEIGTYSFFVFLNIIVDTLFNNTDQVILGIVSGTVAVSVYTIATQITKMNVQCSTIISGLFLPKITKILEEKDSDKKISDLFLKVARIQLYIMLLILSGFIIFGKTFITLWAGEEYVQAYYIAIIIMIPSIIPLTQNIGISILQALNIHQFRSIVYIIIAILNVIISVPLAHKYQGVGAAIGTALANILGQIIIMNIFYYKKVKLDIAKYWYNFIKLALQIVIVIILGLYITSKTKINLLTMTIGICMYTIIYLTLIILNMNKDEKKYINENFNKLLKRIKN